MYEFLLPAGLLDGDPPYWYVVIGSGAGRAISGYTGERRGASEGATTRVIVLEPGAGIDCFVAHYDAAGGYITDYGYPTREAALEDLATEFGDTIGTWRPVPPHVSDPEPYALIHASF